MKAFIITAQKNKHLALKLLEKSHLDEITFSDPQTGHFLGTSDFIKKDIIQANVVIAMIDNDTDSSINMKTNSSCSSGVYMFI